MSMQWWFPGRHAVGSCVGSFSLARYSQVRCITGILHSSGPDSTTRRLNDALNAQQLQAVTTIDRPVMVKGLPGTGRSTVLAAKASYLVTEMRIPAEEILILGPNERACGILKHMTDCMLPIGASTGLNVMPVYALCSELLSHNIATTVFSRGHNQVRGFLEMRSFMRELLADEKLPANKFRPNWSPTYYTNSLTSLCRQAQDMSISPQDYITCAQNLPERTATERRLKATQVELAEIYAGFLLEKEGAGILDTADQAFLAARALALAPELRDVALSTYRHVLVDECEDLSPSMASVLGMLFSQKPGGDVDSRTTMPTVAVSPSVDIFAFSGAIGSVNELASRALFGNDAGGLEVELQGCYRSSRSVMMARQALMGSADCSFLDIRAVQTSGTPKDTLDWMSPLDDDEVLKDGDGDELIHGHAECSAYRTEVDELEAVADYVSSVNIAADEDGVRVPSESVAVLVRRNADIDRIARLLEGRGIGPCHVLGRRNIDTAEGRLLFAFLRAVTLPTDSLALFELAVSPVYKIPPSILHRARESEDRRFVDLRDVLRKLSAGGNNCPPQDQALLRRLLADLDEFERYSTEHTTSELLYRFLDRHRIVAGSRNDSQAAQNVANFVKTVDRLEERQKHSKATYLVPRLADLWQSTDDDVGLHEDAAIAEPGAVVVMTVHKSKGMEFDHVILAMNKSSPFKTKRIRGRKNSLALPLDLMPSELVADSDDPDERARVDRVNSFRNSFREARMATDSEEAEKKLYYMAMTRAKKAFVVTLTDPDFMPTDELKNAFGPRVHRTDYYTTVTRKEEDLRSFEGNRSAAAKGGSPGGGLPELQYLSFSRVNSYSFCPKQYYYRYVLQLKVEPTGLMIQGSALHNAVAEMGMAIREYGSLLSLRKLQEAFDDVWYDDTGLPPRGFLSKHHRASVYKQSMDILKSFYSRLANGPDPTTTVQLVEEPFEISIGRERVKGVFDRVDLDEEGRPILIEFKTRGSVKKFSTSNYYHSQVQLYCMAYETIYGKPIHAAFLESIETGERYQFLPSPENADSVERQVANTAKRIRSGQFDATPSYIGCRYCSFSGICENKY